MFGSPYTVNNRDWAFKYVAEDGPKIWSAVPSDVDIVISHTPPRGHRDQALKDFRVGCDSLLQTLYRVRPMLSVFGHIHSGRGVDRVSWDLSVPDDGCVREENVEEWKDPGVGNKQSILDLTAKGGRPLSNYSMLTGQNDTSSLISGGVGGQESDVLGAAQSGSPKSTLQVEGTADSEAVERAMLGVGSTNAYEQGAALQSDIGFPAAAPDVEGFERRRDRLETAMINAAFMGPRGDSGPKVFNKPIVVDVDLPVWDNTVSHAK